MNNNMSVGQLAEISRQLEEILVLLRSFFAGSNTYL
jgi:hypothetical protein